MTRVDLFHAVETQREPPQVRLRRDDTDTTVVLDAATLLAQYQVPSGDMLLVLDEDCPYEEQLHLVLVRDDTVLDHIVIGCPYATGVFRECGAADDRVRFRFAGDETLSVAVAPQRGLLPARLPRGARRRGGWLAAHWLQLVSEGDTR